MLSIKQTICSLSILFTISLQAQDFPAEISHWFNGAERNKMLKAESLLDQGEQILFSGIVAENKDSVRINQGDYVDLSKDLYLGKRTCRQLYETKDYFRNGFRLKLEVYRGFIDYYLNNEDSHFKSKVGALKDSINIKVENAKELRSRSMISGNIVRAGRNIHQANINDQNAILLCENALKIINESEKYIDEKVNDDVAMVREEIKEDSAVPYTLLVNKKVAKEVQLNVENEIQNVEESLPVTSEPEVYYTVQILADKKVVDPNKIKQVYDGEYEIIENIGDGWYRYSFGKFTNLSKAKKALTESNTKGYIVAYKNSQRIALSEAKSYFLNLNH